jgi:Domain of unknown function (DUF1707)
LNAVSDRADIRASDAERDRAAEALREHYAAGRLDEDELSGRLDGVYGAKTVAELQRLGTDLPSLPPSPAVRRAELDSRRPELGRRLVQRTGSALSPFVVCTIIWAAAGADSDFWPAFLLIFPLLYLVRNTWRLYGPAPDLERVHRELERGPRGPGGHRRRRSSRREERELS